MSRSVSKTQFKARALALFREIESSGESLVITDHGRPALEIRPYKATGEDPLAALRNTVLRFDDPLVPVAEGDWDALQ